MSEINSNIPHFRKSLSEQKHKQAIIKTGITELDSLFNNCSPPEEILNFIENNDISEKINPFLLNIILNLNRSVSQKREIFEKFLNVIKNPLVLTELSLKNPTDSSHKTQTCIFFQVVSTGDIVLLDLVLNAKPQVNVKDNLKRNALFYSINAGKGDNVDIIVKLCNSGLTIDDIDIAENHSPLTLAADRNHTNTVKALLDRGANPNHKDKNGNFSLNKGNSAIHFAVKNNNWDMVKILLNRSDLLMKNKEGSNPIEIASKLKYSEIFNLLVEELNMREEKAKSNSKEIYEEANKKEKKEKIFAGIISENTTIPNDVYERDEQEYFSDKESTPVSNKINENISNSTINLQQKNLFDSNFKNIHYPNYYPHPNQGYMINNNSNNNNLMNVNQIQGFYGQNMPSQNYPGGMGPSFQGGQNMNQKKGQNFTSNNFNNVPNNNNLFTNNPNPLTFNSNNYNYNVPNVNSKKTINASSGINLHLSENNKVVVTKSIPNYSNYSINIPFDFNYKKLKGEFQQHTSNQLNEFIRFGNCPTLSIDISDESKMNKLVNDNTIEEVNKMNVELSRVNSKYEAEIKKLKEENSKLIEELNLRDNKIAMLNNDIKKKEDIIQGNQRESQFQMEEKLKIITNLMEKIDKQDKEIHELKFKENLKMNKTEKEVNRSAFLDKKFSLVKYDDKYSGRCLQKDLLDFHELTKEQIKKMKILQEDLIRLVQEAINEITNEFEVKVYGSHATNLCLPWSDVDLVIISKNNSISNINYQMFLQNLYFNIYDKKWKKSIKYIESAVIPIIKITSTDQYNNMQIDISMQDQKHYGIKCVELVKAFLREYEVLEPLILALKNILKYANLNDPYTGGLSSYGLILMVVSFLQSQLENKKSIKIADLGMIFLEFLWYYGYVFDHSKYVIYAYPQNDNSLLDKEAINNFFLNIQSAHELIIVDPLSKTNNVAKSTYQYINIKMAFMIAFVVAHEDCECGCHYNRMFDEVGGINSEHCILKRIFLAVKRFNSSVNQV